MFASENKYSGRLGKIAYPFRLVGYYLGLCIIVLTRQGFDHLTPLDIGYLTLIVIYPHLGYILYKFSGNDKKLEVINLSVDALLLGGFINLVDLNIIPSTVFAAMIISSHAALKGARRVGISILWIVVGFFVMSFFNGVNLEFNASSEIDVISAIALGLFSIIYSYLGYVRWISLKKAKYSIKKQKSEIELKRYQLEQINKEKDFLIGIAAHDLKSPLNQIIALIQIMDLSKEIPESQEENFQYIQKSVYRMREMIGKILDIHAIEAGDLNFQYETFDIRPFLKELLSNFKNDAAKKEISLHFSQSIEPCVARLDKGFFTQIIENLVSNAIKFSPKGKNVFLNVIKQDGILSIEIEDEGPGIDHPDKKKLFNKFQKLSAKPTADEPSSGLGLSIVKKFTEAMNGDVKCVSEWGKGAKFIVSFKEFKAQRVIPT